MSYFGGSSKTASESFSAFSMLVTVILSSMHVNKFLSAFLLEFPLNGHDLSEERYFAKPASDKRFEVNLNQIFTL